MTDYYYKITTEKNKSEFTHYCISWKNLIFIKALKANGHTIMNIKRVRNVDIYFAPVKPKFSEREYYHSKFDDYNRKN